MVLSKFQISVGGYYERRTEKCPNGGRVNNQFGVIVIKVVSFAKTIQINAI